MKLPPPRSSNITDLDFHANWLLLDWALACKLLKSLRCTHSEWSDLHEAYNGRDLHQALSLHKASLESVWFEPTLPLPPVKFVDPDCLGSLADFTALKFLYAPIADLVGIDGNMNPMRQLKHVLPPSIQALYLRLDKGVSIEILTQLIGSKELPNLSVVQLETGEFEARNNPYAIDQIYDRVPADKLEYLKLKCHYWCILLNVPRTKEEVWSGWDDVWPLDHERVFRDHYQYPAVEKVVVAVEEEEDEEENSEEDEEEDEEEEEDQEDEERNCSKRFNFLAQF